MKGRDITLDIIRILACCMIVFMHAPMPSASASGPFLMGLSYLTAPGIGLFFMVSGALLLPVKDDYFTFMRRRLSKIVLPTVAWTAIYVALNIYMSQSEINIMRTVLSFPFAPQGNGVLWFMYTMTGIYLLAPILSAWLEKASVREIECVLLIWCVTLCYPILENWLAIGTGTTGILYYFTGYAGYFLLGYYLKNYGRRLAAAAPALIAAIGLALVMVLKYKGIEFDFYRLFWYESIFIAALACLIWMVVGKAVSLAKNTLKNGGGNSLCISALSNASFGVYLMHILIMRYWLWHVAWIEGITNYVVQTITVAVLTLVLSMLLCHLMAKVPVLSLLAGYRRRK